MISIAIGIRIIMKIRRKWLNVILFLIFPSAIISSLLLDLGIIKSSNSDRNDVR